MTRPREHFYTCECGGIGNPSSITQLMNGKRKRYIKCRECGKKWQVIVKEEINVEYQGLWLGVNGVWYSPSDQERIREICKNIL